MDRPSTPSPESRCDLERRLATALNEVRPSLRLAMLFGSCAQGRERPDSDVDIALLDRGPLDAGTIFDIAEVVGDAVGRHLDIVDLYHVPTPITGIALGGRRLFGSDECFASLHTRRLIEQEDFGRLRERLMDERIEAWIR